MPPDFDGSNYEDFARALKIYIGANNASFADDAQKIYVAISYFKSGSAATWAENFLEGHQYNPTNFGTWNAFLQAIKELFANVNKAEQVLDQLQKLKQGNMPVADFFQQFEILRRQAGRSQAMYDKEMIHLLKYNVNWNVVDKILGKETPPASFTEWKNAALLFDQHLQQR